MLGGTGLAAGKEFKWFSTTSHKDEEAMKGNNLPGVLDAFSIQRVCPFLHNP